MRICTLFQIHPIISMLTILQQPLTLQFIVTKAQNFNVFESLTKENRTSDHISEIELLTKGQSLNDLSMVRSPTRRYNSFCFI